ncbi:hypothetical protein PLESTF_000930400 [Pleodorina starrii]|nr:hypothetical protein PLESTF_000930400 [Pleodorina starrii]
MNLQTRAAASHPLHGAEDAFMRPGGFEGIQPAGLQLCCDVAPGQPRQSVLFFFFFFFFCEGRYKDWESVLGERRHAAVLGDGMTRSGTPGALPDASHLVAFVAAPPSDPNLLSLPRSFLIDQLTVRISVFDMRDAPVTDSPAAPAAEPPPAPAAGPPPAVQAAPGTPAAGDGTHPAAEPAPTAAPALGRPAAVGVAVMAAGGSPGPLPAPAQAPRPPAAHPSGPPTPSTAGSGPPAPSPASAALSPSSPGMADGQAWWRRPQLVEAPDGPNSLPAVLRTIQDAQNRRLSPYPRAGVGANPQGWGPDSTPIGGTFSPPEAEPATLAAPPGAHQGSPSGTPHQEQQGPSRAPTSPQAGSTGRWWRQPDAFTRHHQPLDPTSARGGPTLTQPPPQAPPTGTAGHHGPGGDGGPELPPQLAPSAGWAARGPPPQLAAHSPTAQAASPPHQPPPGPSTAPGLGLPTAELDVLRAASLITATPSLAAGYHDQFVDYFAACPHPACSSIAFQAVLRKLFLRHHPRLESPELVDPRPVVVAFCRRALHQLDLSPPAPLGVMELDALLLRENHSCPHGPHGARMCSPRCWQRPNPPWSPPSKLRPAIAALPAHF